MQQIPLAVIRRDTTGKGAARAMRVEGMIPAVMYGSGKPAEMLSLASRDLEKVLRQVTGDTAFLSLAVGEDEPRMALLKELQHDHLGKRVVHADFLEVRADQEITVDVTLELTGEAPGVDEGGSLNQIAYTITLMGKIAQIPDVVYADLSKLGLGETLQASDLELPEGVSLTGDENYPIVSCIKMTPGGEEGEEEGSEEEESGEADKE